MSNLNVDEANFKSERAVVEEEYRQRVLADPVRPLLRRDRAASYPEHPYRRGGIGNIEELDAATLDDVRAFHRTYYRPDNAVADRRRRLRPEAARRLDRQVLRRRSPRPAAPIPRVTRVEPARAERRARSRYRPATCRCPRSRSPGSAPPARAPTRRRCRSPAALLGSGESSRINQALVYREQIAQQACFGADLRVDPGLLDRLRDRRQRQDAGRRERGAARRGDAPGAAAAVPRPSSPRSRRSCSTQALHERQTPSGKASALGEATVLDGDAAASTPTSTICRR